ncbi:sigma-70 family RNA polymerase sigma factor [Romboutsia weinsteinii]|uniref:Sigma-70 family RNA polymerase sigma factor n=1 Tax=Romboutsia weinsteinii TaxID=2020949 RepID=A0A371J4Z9_9FIRM|nr:sigma-70 family RNA polymerase sigma factor [Romboutsia weinsteinii]RDY27871.1 sigma-70 family RNA polymerase sigma factor [Romboutsia weinsteinii]
MQKKMIKKIRKRDTKGLDYVINNYSKKVYYLVDKIIGFYGREEVEECVSDVFYELWENIDQFDEKRGEFSSFIYMKTKYKALDYKRRLEKKEVHKTELEDDITNKITTEHIVLDKESSEEIIEIINNFKEPDKTYFYNRYFMYYKVDDIAVMYKTTRASVENRLYRCRLKIKEMLEGRK